jgi:hypothetical protein
MEPITSAPRRLAPSALILVGVAVVLGIAFALRAAERAASEAPIAGVVVSAGSLARDHREGALAYPAQPPVGGVHNAAWVNCGIYRQQVPTESAVHSLEHGAVWISYDPSLGERAVEALREAVRDHPYTLLAPARYGALNAPVVAVAWGTRLEVPTATDPRLLRFIVRYAGGPQSPEPGAVCTGGIGTPNG